MNEDLTELFEAIVETGNDIVTSDMCEEEKLNQMISFVSVILQDLKELKNLKG